MPVAALNLILVRRGYSFRKRHLVALWVLFICTSLLSALVVLAFPEQMKPVKAVSSELGNIANIVEHDLQSIYSEVSHFDGSIGSKIDTPSPKIEQSLAPQTSIPPPVAVSQDQVPVGSR